MKRIFKITGIVAILILGMATTFKPDTNKYFEIVKNIEIFTNLFKEINTYYVDDIDPGKLMRTGLDAMMESLDPYTRYISESDIEGYRYITEGKYNGIGAVSRKIGDFVTITQLYKDQPADKAGLKVGDQLIAIDDKDATGKDHEAINNFLRGFPGTEVELTIRRPGKNGDFKVKLTRDEVNVPNVPYYNMLNKDIGYIALTTFTRDAGRNVANALKELKKENPNLKGVVFDLRDNGGGLLAEAVNISNIFIPKGEVVVTTKGKVKDWDRSFRTANTPLDEEIPLIVLMNNNSASASEIVGGVLQDYDRGILMGQQSYGKGLVQNTKDIGYNAKVKMTTAKYYIPSQRCIQSVEYKNGEPVDIPDDKRAKFKTRNGRQVLDGGGLRPDITIEKKTDAAIIKKLISENLIFDYVTKFCLKNENISEIEDFHFTEFDDFVRFLEENNFTYDSESEDLIKKLIKASKKEGYALSSDLKQLEAKVSASKVDELSRFKETIIDLIEKEIAGRYYYQVGKIKMGLRNDKEVIEAINVLDDQKRYTSILGKS